MPGWMCHWKVESRASRLGMGVASGARARQHGGGDAYGVHREGMRTACTGRGCVRSAQGGDAYGAQGGDAYGAHREENG
ncbi:unnamed protein product [Closterium sp. NIES-64]|nr:unnamed protein product [Closterium sp. NIES-64]